MARWLLEPFRFAGGFHADAVIGGAEVAVADMHVLTAVDIQRVGVGERQIVINGQVLDKHLVAAHQMRRPHRRVADGDITDAHLLAAFQHQHARAHGFRLAVALGIGALRKPGAGPTRQAAFTAQRNVVGVARINQRHAGQFGDGLRQLSRIILGARARQQARPGFQVQGKVRWQDQRAGHPVARRNHQRAATGAVDFINQLLKLRGKRGVAAAVEGGVMQ